MAENTDLKKELKTPEHKKSLPLKSIPRSDLDHDSTNASPPENSELQFGFFHLSW